MKKNRKFSRSENIEYFSLHTKKNPHQTPETINVKILTNELL